MKCEATYPRHVITKMSANHHGDINKALKIIEEATLAGTGPVKIQTYTANTLTLRSNLPDFQITDGLWAGRTLYDLYEWGRTRWDWHKHLFDNARELNITIFSAPFDTSTIESLEDLNSPAFTIVSLEALDVPLIKYAAATGKPSTISTGMSDSEKIHEAISGYGFWHTTIRGTAQTLSPVKK
jgi:sialic acid synthase SpsE